MDLAQNLFNHAKHLTFGANVGSSHSAPAFGLGTTCRG